jgi:replicative DNA helicase
VAVTDDLGARQAPGFERQPPQDLQAEQSVLGGMLLSKDAIADVVEVVRSTDFYRPAHQIVYDTILDLYGRGEPADPVTVSAELTRSGQLMRVGGAPYLHTLISSVPTAANAGYYAEIVAERAVLRRLVEAGTRIVQLGYSAAGQGGSVDEVVDRAQAEVYDVTERRTSEDYVRLEQILQGTMDEIDAISSRGGASIGVPTGFAELDQITNGLHAGQMVVIAARPAIGKALALGTPLPTPTGWTTMGDVQVGDKLIGADGRPTTVVAATDVMLGRPCYEMEFSDGTVVVADGQHQWLTETRASRKSAKAAATGYNRYRNQRTFAAVRTTGEIAETLRCPTLDRRLNHSVINAAPLQLPEHALLLPPYMLGTWLGDGHSASARFTSADPEIGLHIEAEGLEVVSRGNLLYSLRLPLVPSAPRHCVVCGTRFVPRTSQMKTCGRRCGGRARDVGPASVAVCSDCGRPCSGGRLCQPCRDDHGTVGALLRKLGVLNDKHIPIAYLRSSEPQRRALLAGLLDTDGTVMPQGSVQFSVTRRRLAEDVEELILSLGYRCSMSAKQVRGRTAESSVAYTITFTPADEVFRLERKRLLHKERGGVRRYRRVDSRFIVDVRPVASAPTRCVQVDNADHMYLATRSMIPTHNSTLGLDLARSCSIKHRLTSVIFSLEMSRSEITMRLLSAEAKVPLHHMRSGHMSDDDWARLARRMGEVADAPLYIDDSPNLTMMEIRAKARRLRQRHDLRLVVVDYLQLMTSGKRVESRQQEVSEFSRSLKLLAKELDVPVVAISQLNRGPEQRTDKKPLLSDLRESGCMPASTRLLRADNGEEVTLGELVLSQEQPLVLSLDTNFRLVPARLVRTFPSGIKPVFRMRLASGRAVEATANHRFLTADGWRPLDGLDVGEFVAVPRRLPVPRAAAARADWPDDRLILLAHLLGDGSIGPSVKYATNDPANKDAVERTAWSAFGIAVEGKIHGDSVWQLWLPSPYRLTHNRHHPIRNWLGPYGLWRSRSATKFIPEPIFGLADDQLALFLRHLWATDGSITVSRNGRGAVVRIYYATTSRRLAENVQRALLRFEVRSKICATRKRGYGDCWQVTLSAGENQGRFLSRIGCQGRRGDLVPQALAVVTGLTPNPNVDLIPWSIRDRVTEAMASAGVTHRTLAARLGERYCGSYLLGRPNAPRRFSRPRLEKIAEIVGSPELTKLATSDVYWDEVVAITPVGPVPTFDATVDDTHNFVADGIIAHNSIEQDSDMVVLLHREDAYERESPRAGEADLILAKHRNGPTGTVTVAFQGHYSRFVDMAT